MSIVLFLCSGWLAVCSHEAMLDGERHTASFIGAWSVVALLFGIAALVHGLM